MNKMKQNHLGNAFIFMARYALPRKTSADMATTAALRIYWSQIPETHKKRILEEIENTKDLYPEHDPWLWDEFVKDVKSGKVINERYNSVIVATAKKKMKQEHTGPKPVMVVVEDLQNGNKIAVDYKRTAHENKKEAIKLLKEMEK